MQIEKEIETTYTLTLTGKEYTELQKVVELALQTFSLLPTGASTLSISEQELLELREELRLARTQDY